MWTKPRILTCACVSLLFVHLFQRLFLLTFVIFDCGTSLSLLSFSLFGLTSKARLNLPARVALACSEDSSETALLRNLARVFAVSTHVKYKCYLKAKCKYHCLEDWPNNFVYFNNELLSSELT